MSVLPEIALSSSTISGLTGQSYVRACVLDHAAELRDALGELAGRADASVEVTERALLLAAQVRRPATR
jgi:hypothetical protein